jgi:hypothetical protein
MLSTSEDFAHPGRDAVSIPGWPLRLLAHLGDGGRLLQFCVSASALRRQTVYLVATADLADFVARCRAAFPNADWSGDDDNDLSSVLRRWRVRRILAVLCVGEIPRGLMGVLGRIGPMPMTRHGYSRLRGVLAAGGPRAEMLVAAPTVTENMVVALTELDIALLSRAGVLATINGWVSVKRINAICDLAREFADATDDDLAASVPVGKGGWVRWARNWASKAKRFPLAPSLPDGFIPLASADAMKDAARRYNNCLSERVSDALVGKRAYAEWRPGQAIVELEPLSEGRWLLRGIHAPGNEQVAPDVARDLSAGLRAAGILMPARFEDARYRRAAKMLDCLDFDEPDPILLELVNEARQSLSAEERAA